MIFHLLIVDDEATMRRGLSSFINWEAIDCVVADTACDGSEAVAKIKEQQIDIVITDIKMPEIDGLQLAKYIDKNYPEIAVILLTGYAEFEYARTAIRYNVTQLLLKPTSKEEIISAVKEAQQKIIVSKKQDSIAKSEMAFLKEQFLQELTYGTITQETKYNLEKYNIPLNCYYIVAFQLCGSPADISQLKKLIIQQKTNSYCFRYDNLILSIYYQGDLAPIIENCNEIIDIMKNLYSMQLSVGISQQHQSVEEFSTATFEAIHTLSLNFYSTSNIAVFDAQNIQSESVVSAETTLSLFELETAMLNREFLTATSIINSLFMKLQSNFVSATDAKNICSHIYYVSFRVLAKYQLIMPSEEFLLNIGHATDIFQLENIIEQLLQFVQKTLTDSKKKYSKYIQDAITYIQHHLTENITLDDIAQYAHINDSYLSRTFKKECGYSITEYITNLRIEKAKELLSDKHILTYEVSELVGINDPSYFSLLFKKHTGLTPKEYRNQFVHL
ncbi:MAG: response regulator [Suilimivivens sp.]